MLPEMGAGIVGRALGSRIAASDHSGNGDRHTALLKSLLNGSASPRMQQPLPFASASRAPLQDALPPIPCCDGLAEDVDILACIHFPWHGHRPLHELR